MPLGAVLQRSYLVNKTCLRHSDPSHWPMVSGTAAHSPCSLASKKSKKLSSPLLLAMSERPQKDYLSSPGFVLLCAIVP